MHSRIISLTSLGFILILPLASAPIACAQTDEDEEIFELSPFQVSSSVNRGYKAKRTLGSKNQTSEVEPPRMTESGATIDGLDASDFSQFGRGVGVSVRFAIGFYDDEERVRRDTLNRYLDEISEKIQEEEGLRFDAGSILVPEGDRTRSSAGKRSDYVSHGHFTVSFDSGAVESPFEKVRSVRRLVGELDFDSKYAKIFFGEALLSDFYREKGEPERRLDASIEGIANRGASDISVSKPNVPISVIAKADSVELSVSLVFETGEANESKRMVNEFLDTFGNFDTDFGQWQFKLAESRISRFENLGDQEEVAIVFRAYLDGRFVLTLTETSSPREAILALKRSVYDSQPSEVIEDLNFSRAQLVVNEVEKHRIELLKRIAAERSLMDETLGEDFSVDLSLGVANVSAWQHSDSEVAYWMPYSLKLVSNRQRAEAELKAARTHEIAMKDDRPQIVCCGKGRLAKNDESESSVRRVNSLSN